MAQGPLGLPRPFAEEFESPLYMIVEIDRPKHQEQFDDPVIDTINTNTLEKIADSLAGQGIALNKQTYTFVNAPNDLLLFTLELAVTNINVQVIDDIRDEAGRIRGYRNVVVSTTPAQAIERFR